MCIMNVRAGQKLSTITQAMAHNTATIIGDMDLLEEYCIAKGMDAALPSIQRCKEHQQAAYATYLGLFREAVHGEYGEEDHDHEDDQEIGEERTLVEYAHDQARLGRQFYTR